MITEITVTELGSRNTRHAVKAEYVIGSKARNAQWDIYKAGMHAGDSDPILAVQDLPENAALAFSAVPLIMPAAG